MHLAIDRQACYRLYWRTLQPKLAPGLRDSQQVYEEVLTASARGTQRWLDVGCGHRLLPPWRLDAERALVARSGMVVGVDYDHLSLTKHETLSHRLRCDIGRLPFPDGTFDLVTANMVFEHLDKPEQQLREIYRVLAPGGRLIFHTPNKFGYSTLLARLIPEAVKDKVVYFLQRRAEEDVFPAFYRTNSRSAIRRLARLVGLRVVDIRLICSSAQLIVIPPLVVFELLWLRMLMSKPGKSLRPYLIAILEKPA
ncbi:MAG TPA: methyltransferase domain-containing protein [Steroidobacteraceae bacterium]|nr:methyltransferase domain-containing protein [Steroidobacteraceae bacterium]